MERADGNRKMWLLKRTSDHHRPECLAAALALGILAGLVPKLNLLAVILYGLIFFLPVHTWLAVAVSVCVSVLSLRLDATAHQLGQSLLSQASLRPMWLSLERMPLVPWMSLHNTVVLGQFVMGTALLAPVYMLALRLFERWEYGGQAAVDTGVSARDTIEAPLESYAPVTTEEGEPLTTRREPYRHRETAPDIRRSEFPSPEESTVDRSPLIIPPPKLNRAAAETKQDLHAPDEPILFEPVDDAQHRVNAWHMNHAAGEAQYATVASSGKSLTESKQMSARLGDAPARKSLGEPFYPQMTEASAAQREREDLAAAAVPPAPERPDGAMNSLQLAHSASEVLAWVDDLLDECMAAEGMAIVTSETQTNRVPSASSADQVDPIAAGEGMQQRWLLETTIEIVRLTDESMSDPLLGAEQATDRPPRSEPSDLRPTENLRVMPAESMMRAWPSVGGVAASSGSIDAALPVHDAGEPTILNLNQSTGRARSEDRAGFQQLVMAGSKDAESPATVPIEPVKGECLAYLLGHLRQSREGKSS